MPESALTSQDLALFSGLESAAEAVGLTPCLLEAVGREGDPTVAGVLRGSTAAGATRLRVIERLSAFRIGILDGR